MNLHAQRELRLISTSPKESRVEVTRVHCSICGQISPEDATNFEKKNGVAEKTQKRNASRSVQEKRQKSHQDKKNVFGLIAFHIRAKQDEKSAACITANS